MTGFQLMSNQFLGPTVSHRLQSAENANLYAYLIISTYFSRSNNHLDLLVMFIENCINIL